MKRLDYEELFQRALHNAIHWQNRCCDQEEIIELFCLDAEVNQFWPDWDQQAVLVERITELEAEKDAWQGRYYVSEAEVDALAKELDSAMDLLRHAETEMRYAGWEKRLSDNPGRADVYEQIKEFLK